MITMLRSPASIWARSLRTCNPGYRLIRSISSAPPIIRIENATFYQQYPSAEDEASPLYPNLNFVLPVGEPVSKTKKQSKNKDTANQGPLQHWAVIGSSGRSEFFDILRGQYVCLPPTARSYPYLLTEDIAKKDPRLSFHGNAIQYVGFSGEGYGVTGSPRGAYLSARYESRREETDWTLDEWLRGKTSLNPSEDEARAPAWGSFGPIVRDLRLQELLSVPIANLSNGQTRRARIAKALLKKPELLLLDDPFMGLDPATVRSISGLLHVLAEKCTPRLILGLRPQDPLPDWITHLLVLGNSHKVLLQGSRSEVEKAFGVWKHLTKSKVPVLPLEEQELYNKAVKYREEGIIDRQLLHDLGLIDQQDSATQVFAPRGGEPLIEMDGVWVQYGSKSVLGNWKQPVNKEEKRGLHWKVRRGQRWAVLGPNGSGKTTLLSLITSDHPQAYAQPVKLFGRSRLPEPGKPGISIFELQSRIGHSSPEIHTFFPRHLTVRQAIESAWAETFLSKPKLNYDRDLDVSAAIRFFKTDLETAATADDEPPAIASDLPIMLPKIPNPTKKRKKFVEVDHDIEWADEIRFGELSAAQQRLVLFIRAVVHKPDIVILDEALSGMSPSLRDKCLHFLEVGELARMRRSTATRRTTKDDTWLAIRKQDPATIRHRGLTDDQALIVVSHVKEDIPDSVRYWMRLPSNSPHEEGEPLDFRLGVVKNDGRLNAESWDSVWLPPSQMTPDNIRRTWRRQGPVENRQEEPRDEDVYHYWTL